MEDNKTENQKQTRLPKFHRAPERIGRHPITPRDLEIIATVERYRFIPTSLLLRLVAGSPRGIANRLQILFHREMVRRFAFSPNSEFIYYLDSPDVLELLAISRGVPVEELDWKTLENNREAKYHEIHEPGAAKPADGRMMFLHHELMISRFHGMLELGCRHTDVKVELAAWQQGPDLWDSVEVPAMTVDRGRWVETDQIEILPHRPDAFFTLHFPEAQEGSKKANFFYEADRKTTETKKMAKKFRAHFHYVAKQQRHYEKYQVRRIRAVLTETLDTDWVERLRLDAARHPMVSGERPSPLFWFTASSIFDERQVGPLAGEAGEGSRGRKIPRFLAEPDLIFQKVWATPLTSNPTELISLLE